VGAVYLALRKLGGVGIKGVSEALGFVGTFYRACVRPQTLFEAWAKGQVRAHPLGVYAVGQTCSGVGVGVMIAIVSGSSPLLPVVGVGGLFLLFSPLSWLLSTAYVHWLAKLLGSRGTFRDAGSIVGFGGAPLAIGFVPIVSYAGQIWSIIVSAKGLNVLRGMKPWLAVVLMLSLPIVSVGAAFALRITLVEAFKMPSGSMYPSLEVGDHLFVSKSAYGLLSTTTTPRHGDVIVFTEPYPGYGRDAEKFIKRVIAVPGDRLEVQDGRPLINGWPVPRCSLGVGGLGMSSEPGTSGEFFVEFLHGRAYLTVTYGNDPPHDDGPFSVEPGEVYVIGDNRYNSADSRSWRQRKGGGVPLSNVHGQAWWLWLPPSRFGQVIHGAPTLPEGAASLKPALAACLARAPSYEKTVPPKGL
jgi:signal peptidase I